MDHMIHFQSTRFDKNILPVHTHRRKGGFFVNNPLEILEEHLHLHYPDYTVNDFVLAKRAGYLKCVRPCTNKSCTNLIHYHSIPIHYLKSPKKLVKQRNCYWLWERLHGYLPEENQNHS